MASSSTKHRSTSLSRSRLDYTLINNPDGTFTQTVTVDQQNLTPKAKSLNGFPYFESNTQEQVKSHDTFPLSASFSITAPGVGNSSASYSTNNSLGYCYSRSLTAADRNSPR